MNNDTEILDLIYLKSIPPVAEKTTEKVVGYLQNLRYQMGTKMETYQALDRDYDIQVSELTLDAIQGLVKRTTVEGFVALMP